MNKELFIFNREKIFNLMQDNSCMIIFSPLKNESVTNERYNVNRNYFYICGIFEYENIVVLTKQNNICKSYIFINEYDELKAKWVGSPLTKSEVEDISGISNISYLKEYDEFFEFACQTYKTIYLDVVEDVNKLVTYEQSVAAKIKKANKDISILNANSLFKLARTTKHQQEIEEIEKAIEITNAGITNLLSNIGPMYEYQLEAYFDFGVKTAGATGYSFPTIAASGKNSTCLHYSYNNSMAKNGDLILFDLGASLNMYCADISRTYPISGKFTERQKQLYNIVLNGQKLVFNSAKPGLTTKDLNAILVKYYEEKLMEIGLIDKPEDVKKYYYHSVSHHLGLDCHDLCDYGPLRAGSIISNEPGLYIPEEEIGIRIEDDILITETGARWLSPQVLKEVDDIEAFIKENRK